MKKIVFIAGDKSGDLYAGLLARNLKDIYGESVLLYSCGGPELARSSKQLLDLVRLSVSGIIEVAAHFKDLKNAFNTALAQVKKIQPDLVILVDFPDFNLRLAQELHGLCPLFYYISPQVWAWRKNRVFIIKKLIDKMIVLFGFEHDFYQKYGVDSLFFGHPLLDIIPRQKQGTDNRILFFPGSRKNEIKKHLPLMLEIKNILSPQLPEYEFCAVRPENMEKRFYTDLTGDSLRIIPHSYENVSRAKFIVSASGTATLELAILNVPFCIVYNMNTITWWLLTRMVKIKNIGLPNIVCGKKIVEEFIQFRAKPDTIAEHVLSSINNEDNYNKIKSRLQKVKDKLTPYHALKNTATYIGNYLKL